MAQVNYRNSKNEETVYEIDEKLIWQNLDAELETAKREFDEDFEITRYINVYGNICQKIANPSGKYFVEWTVFADFTDFNE